MNFKAFVYVMCAVIAGETFIAVARQIAAQVLP